MRDKKYRWKPAKIKKRVDLHAADFPFMYKCYGLLIICSFKSLVKKLPFIVKHLNSKAMGFIFTLKYSMIQRSFFKRIV